MNRIFRLVFCRGAGQWVPVSEETRGAAKGRRQLRCTAARRHLAALAVVIASLDHAGLALASPSGAQITSGTGTVGQSGNTTTIRQTSTDLALNWQSFNVTANEVVDFIQPSATSIAINRILGNTSSQIFGHLEANGQVWLINPNGILFGKGAQVNVGGLTASTLDVSDATFSASLRSFSGPGTGSVVNQGTIQAAQGGYVALLGNQVSNQGVIRAQLGTVALGAGSAETLTFSGKQLIHLRVEQSTLNDLAANGQLIQADGGRVIMTAGAQNSLLASVVNNTGIVQARSAENHDGTITLLAGMAAGQVNVGGTLDATAPAGERGGSIETSGAAVSVASTAKIIAGPGGSWRIDPTDLTIDATAATAIDTSLNSGTNVIESTTATTTSGAGNTSPGLGDINVNAPIAWTNAAGTLTLSAYNAINVNASVTGSGAVVMQAGTGNLTIASGASIEGDAGVTIGTGANFVNNSGLGNALISASGRWLVYSTSPTLDTVGTLTPGFIEYAAAFGAAPVSQATGNGLLYSMTPSITVTALTGIASKAYDGTTNASLTAANSNYTLSGTLNGDTVNSMTATYQTTDVGAAIPVTSAATATAAAFAVTNSSGIPVYGYGLAGSPVTASIGTITKAQLSAAIVGDVANPNLSKVYDGTTTATLDSGNYQLSGFATGQGASVNQPSSVGYASATAGAETVSATFSPTNFVAASGTKLSNYMLPTTASGSGTVLQAPLVITGVLASDKVYDSLTTDSLNTTHAGMYGAIGSDAVSLSTSGATGTFLSPNVGSNLSVSTSGFSLNGAQANDYQLIAPSSLTASITPAPLSVSGVSVSNKIYDGSAAATLVYNNPQLSGLLGGDGSTVVLSYSSATAAFSSKNVGTSLPVTTLGFSIGGTNASNYDLAQASGLAANITPKQLTVNLVGDPTKPYNGTTTAALSSPNLTVSGFISGEGATIPQTALAEYASPNAGPQTVTATLAVTDFATTGGALLSNYSVPTTATGPGTITPAPVTGLIVGNPTKVYDSTTSATLTNTNYVLTGFQTGQGVTVNQTSGSYASANAGVQQVTATLTTGNYTGTGGTLLSNYSLPTSMTGTGTITPASLTCSNTCLYAAVTGNPNKYYDGNTTATLASGNFALTGLVGTDLVNVTQTMGQYGSANAGIQSVSVVLTNSDFTAGNGTTNLSNYTLPTYAYGYGTIMPVALTVAVVGNPTRVYNGAVSTVLLSANYQITGLVNGEGAVINPSALIQYASPNVGSQGITAALTPSAYTATGNTLLSNYVLATTAAGTGTITSAPVYVTGLYSTNKVYDTTYVDPLNTLSQAVAGVVSSDVGNVILSGIPAGAFTTNQVGNGLSVSVSGLTITGSAAPNYSLQPITGLAANITPAPLTISGVSAISKPYDGTAVATLNSSNAALVGVLTGDSLTPSAAGATAAFKSVDVGSNLKVSASGFTISGAAANDYALSQPTGLSADITPAPIIAQITGNPTKVYDGSASTTLTNANYTLIGFATVGGVTQGAAVPQSATATYGSPNAGVGVAIGSTLVLSDFIANSGTNLSNYQLPTIGSGTGTILQAPLSVLLIGNPTKMYDTTTAATLTSANYTVSGFVSGQSTIVTQAVGAYSSANAGSQSVTATLGTGDYAVVSGTNLANYALPVAATGTGTITRVPLTVSVSTTAQPYNGTTVDALSGATLSQTGVYSGDTPTLAAGTYSTGTLGSSGNAGTDTVTTAIGLSGTNSGNYSITQPSGLTAVISPVQLYASSTASKVYDGTTTANLSGSTHTTVTGFISGEGASVSSTGISGTFATANVGTNIGVTGGALVAGNLTATGSTLLSNYVLPTSDDGTGTITPKALTYTATPSSQQYGLFTPTTLTGTLSGFVNSETLASDITAGSMSGAPIFTTTATVTNNVGHYAIDGSGVTATNYSFAQAAANSTALTITKAPLTVTGVLTNSRAYNGSSSDALSGATLSGTIYNSDTPALTNTAAGTLSNGGNVGTDTVTTSMGLTGTGNGNYSLTQQTPLTAVISAVTLSASSTVSKTYDGTTVASLSGGNTVFTGFASGQGATVNAGVTGTFASPNKGSGIVVTGALTFANLTPSGGWVSGDYVLPITDNGTGTISAAVVNLSGVRTYDAGVDAAASIFGSGGTLATGVNGENLILSGSTTLLSKNAGSEGLSTLTGLTLGNGTGGSAGAASNYTLVGGTDSVAVSKLGITVTGTASNKTYNGSTAATVLTLGSSGVLGSDNVTFGHGTATFNSQNVAQANTVTIPSITEGGNDVGNYTLNNTNTTTAAVITPAVVNLTGTRVYDAALDAAAGTFGSGGTLNTGVGSETLALSGSGTLLAKGAGAESVTGLGSLSLANHGTGASAGIASNYTLIGGTDTLTVTPAVVNLSGTRVYDGGVVAAAGIFGSAGTLLTGVGGETLTLTGSTTLGGKNVGAEALATLTGLGLANGTGGNAGAAGNYTLVGGTDSVTVTPATLIYTANPVSQHYGVTPSGLSGTLSGYATGDTLANATTGTLGFTTLATAASNVNSYLISGAGLTANNGNYTFAQAAGNATALSITPAVLSLSGTRVYDAGVDASFGILSSNGTVNGVNGQTLALSGSGTLLAKNVGPESVTSLGSLSLASNGTGGSAGVASNYTLVGGTDTVTVTAATLTYTATPLSQRYGVTPTGLVGTVSGLQGSDTFANATGGTASFTTLATATSNVNAYDISGAGLTANNGNYIFAQAAGNTTALSITPAVVNLLGTRAYDAGVDAAAGIFGSAGTVATGVNGQTLTLSGGGVLVAKNAGTEGLSALGTLALNNGTGASGGLASNYQLTGGSDLVTVTPLAITVTGTANDKPYNGTTVASLSALGSSGIFSGDTVIFADTAATFNSKNVTTAGTVTIAGITDSGADAGNYTLANTTATAGANITPAIVNLTGSRTYDALLDANAGIFGTAGTVATGVGAETLVLSGSGILAAKNVGVQSTALGTLALGNNGAGLASNYQLTGGSDMVTVTPLAITVAGTANNKTYDGTTAATLSALGSSGVVAGDAVTFANTSATFNSKDVTTANTVMIAGITDSGADAGNYTLNSNTATAGANITPLAITATAVGINKVYDGGVSAAVTLASSGVLAGDSVTLSDAAATFANQNVANGLVVSVAGITEGGPGAGNYTVNPTAVTSANITPAIVNLSGNRTYDALLDANAGIFGTGGTVATGVGAETLALSGSGALTAKNAGTQRLSSIGTLALNDGTGSNAGLASNYQLTGGSDVVTVTPLPITVTGTANNKTYDGTTVASLNALGSSGVIAGDSVTFADTAAAFADKNVASGKTVTISGITDAGADAGNYSFNASAVTTAAVTPATLTENAIPVSVATGASPTLSGSVSGFVAGDTQANATSGTLVWSTNAPVPAVPGSYAIDGSGLTAENYVVVQSPTNAAALTITAAPEATPGTAAAVSGLFDSYLSQADVATPYGVGSANEYGNNTGNARRDPNPTHGNRHVSDFTGHLALTVTGAGISIPPEAH